MLIHAIDPGQRCGFALGEAGRRPESGVVTLRKKSDHRAVGLRNLEAYLFDVWSYRKPDIFCFEPPMSVQAWAENALRMAAKQKRPPRFHGGDAIASANEMAGVILMMCDKYGVRFEEARRNSVMWAVAGHGGLGDRKANKDSIIKALQRTQMLSCFSSDDDQADAVAIHVWASGKFAKKAPPNFGLFAGNSG